MHFFYQLYLTKNYNECSLVNQSFAPIIIYICVHNFTTEKMFQHCFSVSFSHILLLYIHPGFAVFNTTFIFFSSYLRSTWFAVCTLFFIVLPWWDVKQDIQQAKVKDGIWLGLEKWVLHSRIEPMWMLDC